MILRLLRDGQRHGIAVDRGVPQPIVAIPDRDRGPCFFAAGVINVGQRVTPGKRSAADFRHAVRDGNCRQAAAVVERVAADGCHAVRDGHARQTAAVGKRILPDFRHAVRDDVGAAPAPGELDQVRTAFVEQYAVDVFIGRVGLVYGDSRQAAAAVKRAIADFRHAVRDGHARQAAAVVKREAADFRHAVRDGHVRQVTAVGKRVSADFRHAVRDGHACQAAALGKRVFADFRHAGRDGHACQAAALGKRVFADFRHAGRDGIIAAPAAVELDQERTVFVEQYAVVVLIGRVGLVHGDACQAAAAGKHAAADFRHAARDGHARQAAAVEKSVVADFRHAVGDGHAHQAAAVMKCEVADGRHAVGNGHARQAAAVGKNVVADFRHTVRDGHARQAAAIGKRRFADVRHAVRDGNARQAAAVIKRIVDDARHAVADYDGGDPVTVVVCPGTFGHFPRAFDPQHPVAVQGPGEIVPAGTRVYIARRACAAGHQRQQEHKSQRQGQKPFSSILHGLHTFLPLSGTAAVQGTIYAAACRSSDIIICILYISPR